MSVAGHASFLAENIPSEEFTSLRGTHFSRNVLEPISLPEIDSSSYVREQPCPLMKKPFTATVHATCTSVPVHCVSPSGNSFGWLGPLLACSVRLDRKWKMNGKTSDWPQVDTTFVWLLFLGVMLLARTPKNM